MTKEQKQKIDDFFDSHTTEELRDKWEKYAGIDEPKEQFSLYVVRCFKIKARSIKKAIWTYVFRLAKEADKVKNFITR
jgi:hypothetical protein